MTKFTKRSDDGASRAGEASGKAVRDEKISGDGAPKGRTRKSELFQRLKAARTYADKTQEDLADALGITRSAIAYWEARDPDKRVVPTPLQLAQVARTCRIPYAWLVDESQACEALQRFMWELEKDFLEIEERLGRDLMLRVRERLGYNK